MTMSALSVYNLNVYIKECLDCAQTCRVGAEALADNASKFAKYIAACLECAKTCEATAKALLLHKNRTKSIRQSQLEACVMACRVCGQICTKLGEEFECYTMCAESVRRCEEILRALIHSVFPKKSSGIVTLLKHLRVRKAAL